MTIVIGKLNRLIYESNDKNYHVYNLKAGSCKNCSAVFYGPKYPDVLKSVEYVLHGEFYKNKQFGRQFNITKFRRFEAVKGFDVAENLTLNKAVKMLGDV